MLHLMADSVCIHLTAKATSKRLLQWQLHMLVDLTNEYGLSMDVTLVKSYGNKADQSTSVVVEQDKIRSWTYLVYVHCKSAENSANSTYPSMGQIPWDKTHIIFCQTERLGCFKSQCMSGWEDVCSVPVDPVPVHWQKGKLDVKDNWSRLEVDITYDSGHYLTFIDCVPSRFAIWCPLNQ